MGIESVFILFIIVSVCGVVSFVGCILCELLGLRTLAKYTFVFGCVLMLVGSFGVTFIGNFYQNAFDYVFATDISIVVCDRVPCIVWHGELL